MFLGLVLPVRARSLPQKHFVRVTAPGHPPSPSISKGRESALNDFCAAAVDDLRVLVCALGSDPAPSGEGQTGKCAPDPARAPWSRAASSPGAGCHPPDPWLMETKELERSLCEAPDKASSLVLNDLYKPPKHLCKP